MAAYFSRVQHQKQVGGVAGEGMPINVADSDSESGSDIDQVCMVH